MKLLENPLTVILHIAKALERELQAGCAGSCSVTHTDAKLLMMIAYHPGCNSSDLAGLLQVSAPAVSRQIKKLETKGYVQRSVDPNNRRVGKLELTSQGQQIQKQVEEYLQNCLGRLLKQVPSFSKQTKQELIQVAGALGDWDNLETVNN